MKEENYCDKIFFNTKNVRSVHLKGSYKENSYIVFSLSNKEKIVSPLFDFVKYTDFSEANLDNRCCDVLDNYINGKISTNDPEFVDVFYSIMRVYLTKDEVVCVNNKDMENNYY